MTRYIAIEANSGYVWGDATAATPEQACAMITAEADFSRQGGVWERVPPIRDTAGGYHVYVAPEGFPEIDDGQLYEIIRRVDAECAHVGDYRRIDEEDNT